MKNRRNFTMSQFWCTCCGQHIIDLPRPYREQREPGHLKKIYCPWCKAEKNAVEIKPFGSSYILEDFKQEFKLGRFKKGKRCKVSELYSCGEAECKYNVAGKCWNWNENYKCDKRNQEVIINVK